MECFTFLAVLASGPSFHILNSFYFTTYVYAEYTQSMEWNAHINMSPVSLLIHSVQNKEDNNYILKFITIQQYQDKQYNKLSLLSQYGMKSW